MIGQGHPAGRVRTGNLGVTPLAAELPEDKAFVGSLGPETRALHPSHPIRDQNLP